MKESILFSYLPLRSHSTASLVEQTRLSKEKACQQQRIKPAAMRIKFLRRVFADLKEAKEMKILKWFFSIFTKFYALKELSSLAFVQSPVATLLTDSSGMIIKVNFAFQELTGYDESELTGACMSLLKSGYYEHDFYKSFWQKLINQGQQDHEVYNRCKDNTILLMREKIRLVKKDGIEYYIVTLEDISEQKAINERYIYLATHDALTGLANRTSLLEHFSHAALNSARNSHKIGLLMCDLNEFKDFNDCFGHSLGDAILQEVAKKLKQLVRESDIVARYGGDEFVLILEHVESAEEILNVTNMIKSAFPITLEIGGKAFDIGMSCGYACFPDEGTTIEQLIQLADIKMYQVKEDYYFGS